MLVAFRAGRTGVKLLYDPPPIFDGAAFFGKALLWALGLVALTFPFYNFFMVIPLAIALYFTLKFVNRLEERDLRDREDWFNDLFR